MQFAKIRSLLLLFIGICLVANTCAQPIVLGKVSDNPKKHYAFLKHMAAYLAQKLAGQGITKGEVIFTKNNKEVNTSIMVYRGVIDAGVYSNKDWEKFDDLPLSHRGELKTIYESERFLRAVQLVRVDLAPALKQEIKQILLAMDEYPEVKPVLSSYQKTAKFRELDATFATALQEVRMISRLIDQHLN